MYFKFFFRLAYAGRKVKRHFTATVPDAGIFTEMVSSRYIQSNGNHDFFHEMESNDIAELAVEKILAANLDYILCMDDNICLNVLHILQKRQISIPQTIRIASLHNSGMLEKWCPSITCVNYDVDALGKEASRVLYSFLTENKKMPKRILGFEVQMKESTN